MTVTSKTYVVTGASGRVGSVVARGLLAQGHHVRVVGRDAARLQSLVDAGAVPFVGDVRDAAFVTTAFTGADAALLIANADRQSPDFRRDFVDLGASYATALARGRVPAAVFLSTIGAHDPRHRGLVLIHHDVERRLEAVPNLALLHLRAPAFVENLFYFLPATQALGALASAIDPDAALDLATTAEVAALTVRCLTTLDFLGTSALELHGSAPTTHRRIAATVGAQLGAPFGVVHTAREADIEAMVAAGMGRDFSTLMNDTWDTFSRYGLMRQTGCRAVVAAAAPLEEFLRDRFVPALRTVPARRHMRLEYVLRADVDVATYEAALRGFVAQIRAAHPRNQYDAFRTTKDARQFVHVGAFDEATIPALQQQPFFVGFTTMLRQSCERGPDTTMMIPV